MGPLNPFFLKQAGTGVVYAILAIILAIIWDALNLNEVLFPWLFGFSIRSLLEGSFCCMFLFVIALVVMVRPVSYQVRQ